MAFASPRSSPRMMSASPRLALKGYTEQELVAEARLRNSYNRQARILKKVLQDSRIPGEDTVSAIDLRYAAERTKLQVPAKFLSSPRVSWRTVISDMERGLSLTLNPFTYGSVVVVSYDLGARCGFHCALRVDRSYY